MATSFDFIEFVMDCLQEVKAEIRYRKMFGEYMVYANDKPVLLVCDNKVYVKMIPQLESFLRDSAVGYPYEGAKLHYLLDIEDAELVRNVLPVLEEHIPLPKPRKKKQ